MSKKICPLCHKIVHTGIQAQDKWWHENCLAKIIVTQTKSKELQNELHPSSTIAVEQQSKIGCCLMAPLHILADVIFSIMVGLFLGGSIGGLSIHIALHLFFDNIPFFIYIVVIFAGIIGGLWLAWEGILWVMMPIWVVHGTTIGFVATLQLFSVVTRKRKAPKPLCPICHQSVENGVSIKGQKWHSACLPASQPHTTTTANPVRSPSNTLTIIDIFMETLELPLVLTGGILTGGLLGALIGGVLVATVFASMEALINTILLDTVLIGALLGIRSALYMRFGLLVI